MYYFFKNAPRYFDLIFLLECLGFFPFTNVYLLFDIEHVLD